jgi:hypothetical protein
MYDNPTTTNIKSEIDELVDLFRNFDKKGFAKNEVEDILSKRKSYLLAKIKDAIVTKHIKKGGSVSVFDDENSLIYMFKELAKEKERNEAEKTKTLMA